MAAATPAITTPGLAAPAVATSSDRLKDRWGLAVLGAVALFVLGPIVLGGSTPDTGDGAQKIHAYYADHAARQTWAAALLAVSGLVFLVFSSALLRSLRRVAGTDAPWPWLAFGASLVMSTGMLMAAGMHVTLAQDAGDLSPVATSAVNSAEGAPWIALIGGLGLMVVGVVAATWRARSIPRWMAILGIVFGVGTMTPVGWIVGLGSFLWLIGLGVMMATRGLGAQTSS